MKIILISGPPGVGKDYLISHILDKYKLKRISTVTTRPPRSPDEKSCISEKEYNDLLKNHQIVGDHPNKGFRYGYNISEFSSAENAILIINPSHSESIIKDLSQLGVQISGWIGVYPDEFHYVID